MKKSSWQAARFRRATATAVVLALASVAATACDESTGPGAVSGVDIVVLPVGTPTTNLLRGSSLQLLAAPHDANDQFVDLPVTWSTSDAAKATVDADGTVTIGTGAAAGGTVTITATAGGQSGTFELQVQHPVSTVTLNPTTATIRQEGTVAIGITLVDAAGNTVTGRTVTWSSSNTAIATVNSSGVVSGVANGTVTITATAVNGDVANATATATVTVSGAPLVATVVLTPGSAFRGVGQTIQLAHESRAASGTVIPGTTATWSTSSATVATVSATGLVTIIGPGTATIRATVDNGIGTNIQGAATIEGATVMVNGVGVAVPTVAEEEFIDYAFIVAGGAPANFSVATTSTATGDNDTHVFAPGVTPAFVASQFTYSNFVCRPWNVGSAETCSVGTTANGTYRIRFYNYPGEGALSGMTATLTHP